jgi:hypothetical protein
VQQCRDSSSCEREGAQKFSSGAAQQGARWLLELLRENGIEKS